jgi:hypothetical protein
VPAAGELVPAGTSVILKGRVELPGGFGYTVSAFEGRRGRPPCADGRHLLPPERQ